MCMELSQVQNPEAWSFPFFFLLVDLPRSDHWMDVTFMSFPLTQSGHSPRKKKVYTRLRKKSDLRTLAHRKGLWGFSVCLKSGLFFSSCELEEEITVICSTSVFPLYCGCLQRNLFPSTLM